MLQLQRSVVTVTSYATDRKYWLVTLLLLACVRSVSGEAHVTTMALSRETGVIGCEFVVPGTGCSNLLQCARLCEQNTACEAVIYNGKMFKINRNEGVKCTGSWTKMLSMSGAHLTGDVNAVTQLVVEGGRLETVHTSGPLYVKQLRVDKVYIKQGVLCTQSEALDMPSTGQRKVFLFCTSGYNRELTWTLFPPHSVTELDILYGDQVDWYLQSSLCSSLQEDPQAARHALTQLGSRATVLSKPSPDTYVQQQIATMFIGLSDLRFHAQPNHATVEFDILQNAFVYHKPYTIQSVVYDFNNTRGIMEHPADDYLSASPTTYTRIALNVRLHTNWYKLYETDQNGNATFGNSCNLRKKIDDGLNVNVFSEGMLFEPVRLYIVGEHVFAMCHVDYIVGSGDSGNTSSLLAFIVSTRGSVQRLTVDMVTGGVSVSEWSAASIWYVEQVGWRTLYDSEASQEQTVLKDKVHALSSLRLVFHAATDNYTLVMKAGPVIQHTDTGLFQVRLLQTPEVAIYNGTVSFQQNHVLIWVMYRVNIFPSLCKLTVKTRPHGNNDFSAPTPIQGRLIVFKQTELF